MYTIDSNRIFKDDKELDFFVPVGRYDLQRAKQVIDFEDGTFCTVADHLVHYWEDDSTKWSFDEFDACVVDVRKDEHNIVVYAIQDEDYQILIFDQDGNVVEEYRSDETVD